jgi:hypothetical protein
MMFFRSLYGGDQIVGRSAGLQDEHLLPHLQSDPSYGELAVGVDRLTAMGTAARHALVGCDEDGSPTHLRYGKGLPSQPVPGAWYRSVTSFAARRSVGAESCRPPAAARRSCRADRCSGSLTFVGRREATLFRDGGFDAAGNARHLVQRSGRSLPRRASLDRASRRVPTETVNRSPTSVEPVGGRTGSASIRAYKVYEVPDARGIATARQIDLTKSRDVRRDAIRRDRARARSGRRRAWWRQLWGHLLPPWGQSGSC